MHCDSPSVKILHNAISDGTVLRKTFIKTHITFELPARRLFN